MKIKSSQDAYEMLMDYVLAFIEQRPWDIAGCKISFVENMARGEQWLINGGERLEKGGFESRPSAIWDGLDAASFLRDDLLNKTGSRIWGLTFFLHPDGKFEIEYDYNKPVGYEESGDALQEADVVHVEPPGSPLETALAKAYVELQTKTAVAGFWGLGAERNWYLDMNAGELAFDFDDGRIVKRPVQIIGTLDTRNGSFMWGWEHPSVPTNLRRAAERLRQYGEQYGVAEMTTPIVDISEDQAWRYAALAAQLDEAAGAYRGNANGTWVYMVFGEDSR